MYVWTLGLQILVGFADKLRLMNLLWDDIRTSKEFNIKGCGECCFSSGGQYFAATQSNAVHIFETYTCVSIGNLRAHSGKVSNSNAAQNYPAQNLNF